MCYSAEASFIASGALAGCSIAIHRLPKESTAIPLSLVPAVFAAHQFVEGIIWLNQDEILPEETVQAAILAYVLIAYILWPVYIPFAANLVERGRKRKYVIVGCQVLGLIAGLGFLTSILLYPVSASPDCCHIVYHVRSSPWLFAPYLLAVSVSFLASSQKSLVLFGSGIALSCAAAAYLSTEPGFPSLWCFFAALLSGGLYLHFRHAAQGDFQIIESSDGLGSTVH
jgi:hypothetical protein